MLALAAPAAAAQDSVATSPSAPATVHQDDSVAHHPPKKSHKTTHSGKKRSTHVTNASGCTPLGHLSCGDSHLAFKDSVYDKLWPVKGPALLPGSVFPNRRVVAFYGNPLSKRMGILGEFPPDTMLARLEAKVDEWRRIDPSTPVQPALHMIAVVAQASPGKDGKYRLRMDSSLIEKVYGWAKQHNALLFLDVQIAQSTLQEELPRLAPFLQRPDVHLGIDPEFSMHHRAKGIRPGKRIGTMNADDINYASQFLQGLVTQHQLPPKVLVVHRFTKTMVIGADSIKLDPRVQIVMDMDGFGAPWLKRDSFWAWIKREPVQFAGWKQFTKLRNDKPPTPDSVLVRLFPAPVYIQYQ